MSVRIARAAYDLMHNSSQGLHRIAEWLSKSPNTLQNEVNPNVSAAKVGWEDIVEASVFTGNRVALNAFGAEMNCMVLPLPDGTEGDKFADVTAMAKEFADLIAEVSRTMADGRVSDNELGRVNKEAGELIAAVQNCMQHLIAQSVAQKRAKVAA